MMDETRREEAPKGDSFPKFMAMVQAGDEGATREVHDRWSSRLIRLARARLGRSVASKEDAEDVVQSAYRSFFRRYGHRVTQFEDWAEVWALLATIAKRKCSTRRKYYHAGRRDARREMPITSCDAVSPELTAQDAAMLSETVDRLLNGLEEPERSIVLLSLQGYSAAEISTVVVRSERTVHRVRERVRSQLERWKDEEEALVSV
jgi:RNA polymerase sigma-70 factor (ECF subfamily)